MNKQNEEKTDYLEHKGIEFFKDKIQNLQDNYPFKTIERDSINSIKFKYGFLSKKPMFQLVFGIALIFLGLIALKHIIGCFIYGGEAHSIQFLFILFIPFGSWIVYDSQKKGHYIEVYAGLKHIKLTFEEQIDIKEIGEFINDVNTQLGYGVEDNLA